MQTPAMSRESSSQAKLEMSSQEYLLVIFPYTQSHLHGFIFFFLNDTPPPEFSPLPLPAALPISRPEGLLAQSAQLAQHRRDLASLGDEHLHVPGLAELGVGGQAPDLRLQHPARHRLDQRGRCGDRKSTRLNSSHSQISYAVFCLK